MDKFYIDREFGQAIWIDVENGIVLRCYNEEPKFIDKMNELYVGKSINFLNEDFIGRAMKNTYHHLRPDCITTLLRRVDNLDVQISHQWNVVTNINKTKEEQQQARSNIKDLEIQQAFARGELKSERDRITREHGFEWLTQSDFKAKNSMK